MQYMRQCYKEKDHQCNHQCKLQRVTTTSACRVFALVDGRKNTTSASC